MSRKKEILEEIEKVLDRCDPDWFYNKEYMMNMVLDTFEMHLDRESKPDPRKEGK